MSPLATSAEASSGRDVLVGSWLAPIGAAVLATAAAVISSGVVRPLIYIDEAGYLLNARGIAGWGDPSGTKYFSGYSYLLAPVQRLFDEYPAIVRGTQAVNIGLLVAAFALLCWLVARTGEVDRITASLAALATCLFPAYLLFPSLALSENVLLPGVLLCCVWVHGAASHPGDHWRWLVAGLGCAAIVAVHPRAVVVGAAFGAVLVTGLIRRSTGVVDALSGIAGLAIGALVSLAALSATDSLPWGPNESGGQSSSTAFLERALSWHGLGDLLSTAFGHLFYAGAATLGFAAVGVWWFLRTAWGRRDPWATTAGFVLVTLCGSVVLSAAHAAGSSGDGLVYGRYNEPFLAASIAMGVAVTASGKRPLAHLSAAVVGIAVPAALARLALDAGALGGRVDFINVLGIMAPIRWLGGVRVGWIAAIALAAAVTIHVVRRLDGRLMIVLTGVAFVIAGTSSVERLWEDAAARAEQAELARIVSSLPTDLLGRPPCIALHPTGDASWHTWNYQVLLPRHRFAIVDLDEPWCSDLLLSSAGPSPDLPPASRLVRAENHSPYALWTRPGPVLDLLEERGAVYPANWDGIVPLESRRAQIDAPAAITASGEVAFDVVIRHTGSGSPWPNDASLTPFAQGPVRLAVRGVDADLGTTRYSLDRSLAPGESTTVHVVLTEGAVARVREEGGDIRLELVQDSVVWFGDDAAVTIAVIDGPGDASP